MTTRTDPPALRWLIGAELNRYRREAELTLNALSRRCGIGVPKLGHMEAGRYQQFPDDIGRVLTACGAPRADADRLCCLAGQQDARAWWAPFGQVVPDWVKTFVGLEALAASEFVFEPMVLPGLLQTEEYARELTKATGFVRPEQQERFVAFRQARAKRLTDPAGPLRVHAVVTEAALRLAVGDRALMRRQLVHLRALITQPHITVQVLRPEDGPHSAGAVGQFVVLDFTKVRSIAYTELLDGAMYVQEPEGVRTYAMVAENLRRRSLTPGASTAFIERMLGRHQL